MSKEAVRLFLQKAEQDEHLQDIILAAFETMDESVNLIELGQEHGFHFTKEEGLEVWDEIQNEEELSGLTLELISGGSTVEMGNNGGTRIQK